MTPVDLWRLQKKTDFDKNTMVLEPHPGSDTRPADVKVEERDGRQVVLIPAGLAVTKDSKNQHGAYHYTIAPKDDMPLDLFLQHLRSMALAAELTN